MKGVVYWDFSTVSMLIEVSDTRSYVGYFRVALSSSFLRKSVSMRHVWAQVWELWLYEIFMSYSPIVLHRYRVLMA